MYTSRVGAAVTQVSFVFSRMCFIYSNTQNEGSWLPLEFFSFVDLVSLIRVNMKLGLSNKSKGVPQEKSVHLDFCTKQDIMEAKAPLGQE